MKTASEPAGTTVGVGDRAIFLWHRHVQTGEDYLVEATLERGDTQP